MSPIPVGILAGSRTVTTPAHVLLNTFTRANSTSAAGAADTGQSESQLSGVWGVDSNKAYNVSGSGLLLDSWDSGISNGTFQVDVNLLSSSTPNQDIFLMFRGTNVNNCLVIDLFKGASGTGAIFLYKIIGGSFTQLGSSVAVAGPSTTTHTIKAVCSGTTVEAWYDGVKLITYTTATGQESATKVGIGLYDNLTGVRFDNLTAD